MSKREENSEWKFQKRKTTANYSKQTAAVNTALDSDDESIEVVTDASKGPTGGQNRYRSKYNPYEREGCGGRGGRGGVQWVRGKGRGDGRGRSEGRGGNGRGRGDGKYGRKGDYGSFDQAEVNEILDEPPIEHSPNVKAAIRILLTLYKTSGYEIERTDIDEIVRGRDKQTVILWIAAYKMKKFVKKRGGIASVAQRIRHLSVDKLLQIIAGDETTLKYLGQKINKRGNMNTDGRFNETSIISYEELYTPTLIAKWMSPKKDSTTALNILKKYIILMFDDKDGITIMTSLKKEPMNKLSDVLMKHRGMEHYIKDKRLRATFKPIQVTPHDYSNEKLSEKEKKYLNGLLHKGEYESEGEYEYDIGEEEIQYEEVMEGELKPSDQERKEEKALEEENDSMTAVNNNSDQNKEKDTEYENSLKESQTDEREQVQTAECKRKQNPMEASKCTEYDIEDLSEEEVKDKLKPFARDHFCEYYDGISEALYQHFASLPAHKMCGLMFREGRLKSWITATGLKSPAEREREKANKKRNRGKQYGIGSNSTDRETVFHIQVTKNANAGKQAKTDVEIVKMIAKPLFEITSELQHTFRMVSPMNELDVDPITDMEDIPDAIEDYIMNGHFSTPRTYKLQIKAISSLQIGALRNLNSTVCLEGAKKMVNYMNNNDLRMEILDREQSSHTSGLILIGTNEWDDNEGIKSEIIKRVALTTGYQIAGDNISIHFRKTPTQRDHANTYTLSLVLDSEEVDKKWRLKSICGLNDAKENKTQFPLTHNIFFTWAQVNDEHPLEDLEEAIKLQNRYLATRYICTVEGIPNSIDLFNESLFTRSVETGVPPASVIIFDQAFYEKLGIPYEGIITNIGKLRSGDYYFQGKDNNMGEILMLLTTHLQQMLQEMFRDSYDFTGIKIYARGEDENKGTESALSVLEQYKKKYPGWTMPAEMYDVPPPRRNGGISIKDSNRTGEEEEAIATSYSQKPWQMAMEQGYQYGYPYGVKASQPSMGTESTLTESSTLVTTGYFDMEMNQRQENIIQQVRKDVMVALRAMLKEMKINPDDLTHSKVARVMMIYMRLRTITKDQKPNYQV